MPTSQQSPGCRDRAWSWALNWRTMFTTKQRLHAMETSRDDEIVTRHPSRVAYPLVTVSQGRGNVTEGARHRSYALLTKCINILIYDELPNSLEIALNVIPLLAKVNISISTIWPLAAIEI
eukprot:2080170-Pleurochrysis_carterae.AAC.1